MKQMIPSESLLTAPGASSSSLKQIERSSGPPVTIALEFIGTTFRPKAAEGSAPNFSRQYAHAYAVRLFGMRPILEDRVAVEWKQTRLKKISELCQSSSNQDHQATSASSPSKKSPVKRSRESDDHGQHLNMREDIVVGMLARLLEFN